MSGTQYPPYPWSSGQQLGAKQLDDAFNNLYDLLNNLSNVLGIIQSEGVNGGPVEFNVNWGGGALTTPGEYILLLLSPYIFVIDSVVYDVGTSGGTFTFTINNNHVPIPGLTNIVVSSSNEISVIPTSGASFAIGAQLDIHIISVSGAPTDGVICIQGHKAGNIPTGGITVQNAIADNASLLITDDGIQLVFNVLN